MSTVKVVEAAVKATDEATMAANCCWANDRGSPEVVVATVKAAVGGVKTAAVDYCCWITKRGGPKAAASNCCWARDGRCPEMASNKAVVAANCYLATKCRNPGVAANKAAVSIDLLMKIC